MFRISFTEISMNLGESHMRAAAPITLLIFGIVLVLTSFSNHAMAVSDEEKTALSEPGRKVVERYQGFVIQPSLH